MLQPKKSDRICSGRTSRRSAAGERTSEVQQSEDLSFHHGAMTPHLPRMATTPSTRWGRRFIIVKIILKTNTVLVVVTGGCSQVVTQIPQVLYEAGYTKHEGYMNNL